jgi:hypothetical protein
MGTRCCRLNRAVFLIEALGTGNGTEKRGPPGQRPSGIQDDRAGQGEVLARSERTTREWVTCSSKTTVRFDGSTISQLRLATSFDNAVGEASSKNEVPNEAGNDGLRDPAHERNLLGCRPIPRISAARECGPS